MRADHLLVYLTVANETEALRIGRVLVEERQAACVNLLGPIRSMYHWDGAVQDGQEYALVAKTTRKRFAAFVRRARELHSYACPCIVGLPISGGHPGFLDWIEAETRMPPQPRPVSRPVGSRRAARRGTGSKRASAPK